MRDTVPLNLKSGANRWFIPGRPHRSSRTRSSCATRRASIRCRSWSKITATTRCRRSCCSHCSRARTIDFQNIRTKDNTQICELIPGKIVRSGFIPGGNNEQPIIEVNGKLQFSLPGQPLFPDLGNDTILKPAFNWLLQSDQPGKFDAEVGYITGGFDWSASYNLVSPDKRRHRGPGRLDHNEQQQRQNF